MTHGMHVENAQRNTETTEVFMWKDETDKGSNVSATSNANGNPNLNEFRYHNRVKRLTPVSPTRSQIDTIMIYVSLFLSVVAVGLALGFHVIFG